jgi:dihydrofolate reductase
VPLVRVHNFSISLDGFGSGEPQSLESPFGHAGQRLHTWMFATTFWDPESGRRGVDAALAARHEVGFGAEIMGANKFGPPGWQDDPDWRGWWGEDPPYHAPVFVLTHYPREPVVMQGGTTFNFVTDGIQSAMSQARAATTNGDIAIAGGASTVRQFLGAGLIDELRLHIAPVLLGAGERLFDGMTDLAADPVAVSGNSGPDGVTHITYRIGTG